MMKVDIIPLYLTVKRLCAEHGEADIETLCAALNAEPEEISQSAFELWRRNHITRSSSNKLMLGVEPLTSDLARVAAMQEANWKPAATYWRDRAVAAEMKLGAAQDMIRELQAELAEFGIS